MFSSFNKENHPGKKIFSFGEILLRMSPTKDSSWLHQQQMPAYIGGSECNVAAALALWNLPVQYCTAMPDNYLSTSFVEFLQQRNVDTSAIIFSGNKLGIYYMQQGTDLKHKGVIYDRAHSSFAALMPGTIDWDEQLKDTCWFHFSAISPSLNNNVALVCEEALQAAAKKNIFISVDLNYRVKLWQQHRNPLDTMPQLASYCHLIMGNIWSANALLGAPLHHHLLQSHTDDAYTEHANVTTAFIQQQFTNCKIAANTFRFDAGENGIRYFASLHLGDKHF
ncbi:MAG TPA: PfkB family carbohydrate kinase, partial [Chitinophagaceae bacterium]|nr:PfkB family carbohydrate kinase [Chitinophagaceae bacterium]